MQRDLRAFGEEGGAVVDLRRAHGGFRDDGRRARNVEQDRHLAEERAFEARAAHANVAPVDADRAGERAEVAARRAFPDEDLARGEGDLGIVAGCSEDIGIHGPPGEGSAGQVHQCDVHDVGVDRPVSRNIPIHPRSCRCRSCCPRCGGAVSSEAACRSSPRIVRRRGRAPRTPRSSCRSSLACRRRTTSSAKYRRHLHASPRSTGRQGPESPHPRAAQSQCRHITARAAVDRSRAAAEEVSSVEMMISHCLRQPAHIDARPANLVVAAEKPEGSRFHAARRSFNHVAAERRVAHRRSARASRHGELLDALGESRLLKSQIRVEGRRSHRRDTVRGCRGDRGACRCRPAKAGRGPRSGGGPVPRSR